MASARPTRLDLHRAKYFMEEKKGTLFPFEHLCSQDFERLSDEFFSLLKRNQGADPYELYAQLLSEWGIMCQHPVGRRVLSTSGRWFFCRCCKSYRISSSSSTGMPVPLARRG